MAELFAMKTPTGQLDPNKLEYPVMVQPKLDGLRGIAKVQNGSVTWSSFTGKPLWNLPHTPHDFPGDGVYDGEIIWPGHPFSDAYGLCKRQTSNPQTVKDAQELRFVVFDRLDIAEWYEKKSVRTFMNRMVPLRAWGTKQTARHGTEGLFGQTGRAVFLGYAECRDAQMLERIYRGYLDEGHEGLMAKNPDGLYYWKRHADWHRYKPTETMDVRVVETYEEVSIKGVKKGTLGGVVVVIPAVTEGQVQHPSVRCKVGGGFTKDQRSAWWKDREFLIGQMIEVEFKCKTKTGSLREPHFVRLREDK